MGNDKCRENKRYEVIPMRDLVSRDRRSRSCVGRAMPASAACIYSVRFSVSMARETCPVKKLNLVPVVSTSPEVDGEK